MRFFVTIVLFLALQHVMATSDSSNILHQDEFLMIVVKNHPLVKKANLIEDKGDINVRKARGGFDPYLYNYFSEKQFKDTKYYSILNGGLKVPTWYGVEGKIGYDNASGNYLNPENNLPTDGLITAGVSVSVGKGMFMDERRKTLQKAKIFDDLSDLQKFNEVNTILFSAVKTYWNWVIAYNHLKIYQNSVELAKVRFEGVKKNFYQGAEPAIDTLEAFIQLQNRLSSFHQANIELTESKLLLSNFLWQDDNTPLEITAEIKAPEILDEFHNYIKSDNDIEAYQNWDINNHPVYQAYNLKINSLNVERKYYREALKPKINLNYNFLLEPTSDASLNNLSTDNYKWGIEIGMPIFLRQQRGDLQLNKVAIEENKYLQMQKALEINNKIEYYFREIKNLEIQEHIFTRNTVNYERLLDAEKRKFDIGESSLFLINSRENKVIASQIKLIDIRGKYQKSISSLTYSAGQQL